MTPKRAQLLAKPPPEVVDGVAAYVSAGPDADGAIAVENAGALEAAERLGP